MLEFAWVEVEVQTADTPERELNTPLMVDLVIYLFLTGFPSSRKCSVTFCVFARVDIIVTPLKVSTL